MSTAWPWWRRLAPARVALYRPKTFTSFIFARGWSPRIGRPRRTSTRSTSSSADMRSFARAICEPMPDTYSYITAVAPKYVGHRLDDPQGLLRICVLDEEYRELARLGLERALAYLPVSVVQGQRARGHRRGVFALLVEAGGEDQVLPPR